MQALHFGAGNIGRGFIGYLLNKSDYKVCFVDVNQDIIESINKTNSYKIELLDDDSTREIISPVSALNSIKQRDRVIDSITEADLITTSVGIENLPKIAGLIAAGLLKRIENNKTEIDVIANENAVNASSTLKKEVEKNLSAEEIKEISKYVGFPNSAIDRLALSKEINGEEVALVEPVYEWVINKSEMKNTDLPPIEDVIYVDDLEAYINRKFYMINMAHAATAYVGFRAGEKTIQSTLADPKMREFIKSVLNEVKKYIVIDSHFSAEELDAYIEKTISRFKNENISDDVRRVGRAPIRKLGSDERLVKPLRNLFELDLPLESLTIVIAAAFRFDNSEDEEAVRLQKYIQEKGIEQAIPHFTGIVEEELINKIEKYYLKLENTEIGELIKNEA
ncbi:mannitol-1-phosphate 5-dehydrogenase [Halanaerobium sp. ST460_2HS_T2]|uniref:mannitol-1-phosphate 5-dehydrogenase n=1 Tax=Halanaerobium sp. ST460_2HS_T2 TaxID=2183914 RepID=UPI000DF23FC3|nr:mannitol-1-phosphate 5-dehydrogenase [Halanaerobium sp. ST460_2HS_T2]RCW52974.1 D-mannitol 1-phosphate 5-dehydrogenase [Halanaerobium sp. ST460_2HS_T2]